MRLFRYYLAVNRDGETGRGVTLTRQHVKGGTGPLPKSNPVPPALFLLPSSLLLQSIRSIFRYFPSSFRPDHLCPSSLTRIPRWV